MVEPDWTHLTQALRRSVRGRIRSEAEVDDVVQETLLRVLRQLPTLRDEAKLLPWARQIARNAATDHLRAVGRLAPEVEVPVEIEQPANENKTVQSWLIPMLQLLNESDREALWLVEVEGLSQAELARRLDLSSSGARTRVQRARKRLRSVVEDCCAVALDRRGNVLETTPRNCECP